MNAARLSRAAAPPAVDILFDLAGATLPADHAWPLREAIAAHLPWLRDDPHAGVHPLRTLATAHGEALLPQRAKLVLRVAQARAVDALRLAHAQLVVDGRALAVGTGKPRTLVASATVAAQRVASDAGDAAAFEAEAAQWIAALGIEAHVIAGRPRRGGAGQRSITGYAVTLHGLRGEDSLRVQYEGLGRGRNLGWGLFVPAKAIAVAND
ncbi:MAG: type I-MYXAN CRISPR-associated protein Cas6/Cmx6 [Burkholderiales bacterium]